MRASLAFWSAAVFRRFSGESSTVEAVAQRSRVRQTRSHEAAASPAGNGFRFSLAAFISLGAFLLTVALAAAPGLHHHLHADAGQAQHECAITVVESGTAPNDPPSLAAVAQPVSVFWKAAPVHSVWVPAPFVLSRVFEHAPPALS